jgi:hypothetical protein
MRIKFEASKNITRVFSLTNISTLPFYKAEIKETIIKLKIPL